MTFTGDSFTVVVRRDLGLEVRDRSDQVVWNSSAGTPPCIVLADGSRLGLGAADQRESCDFEQDGFCGVRITLKEYPGYDAVLELIVAIDADDDTLLVQVEQVELLGAERLVYGRIGDEQIIMRTDEADRPPMAGDTVKIAAREDKLHWFDAGSGKRAE